MQRIFCCSTIPKTGYTSVHSSLSSVQIQKYPPIQWHPSSVSFSCCQIGSVARLWGALVNSNLGALPFPPLHFPLPPLSLLFPSPAPPPPWSGPQIQLERLGSTWQSPSRNRIWCILALKSVYYLRWHNYAPFHVSSAEAYSWPSARDRRDREVN